MKFTIGAEYHYKNAPVLYMGDEAGVLCFQYKDSRKFLRVLPGEVAGDISETAPAAPEVKAKGSK